MSAHSGDERLGPYRLQQQLGAGGMGVVYLASDWAGSPVAVKVLRQGVPAEATARRRLAREVATMQLVHSPYVAEVVDADVEGDPPYIVTRYVPGRTLEDAVAADGPLTGAALASLARGLAAALVAVHSAGVVHRDLKPGNIMLVDGRPVVIDFGIAQAADSTRLTMTGMFMGTPGYLAPEVIEGRPNGAPADVHSWAAAVAYAATGRPPYGTGQFEAIFYRIVHGQPDLDRLPAALLPVLLAALDRDPARRPSAAELVRLAAGLDPAALVPSEPGLVPSALAARVPGPAGLPAPAPAGALPAGRGLAGAPVAAGLAAAGLGGAALADAGISPAGAPQAAAASPPPGATAVDLLRSQRKRGRFGRPGRARPGQDPRLPAGSGVAGSGVAGSALAGPAVGQASSPGMPWPATRPIASRPAASVARDNFGDLLTPVRYGPSPAAPMAAAGFGVPPPGRLAPAATAGQLTPPGQLAPAVPGGQLAPAVRGRGRADFTAASSMSGTASTLLVLATVAALVAMSVLLPVAGTVAALSALVLLRAADVTGGWLGRRRSRQGPRPSDTAAAAAFYPLAVCRSALAFVLMAPLALVCAAAVATMTVLAAGGSGLPTAGSYAAGALVACYCIGPGSRRSRRPLSQFYGRVTSSAPSAILGTLGLAALAVFVVAAALTLAPGYWPAEHLGNQLQAASLTHRSFNHLGGNVLNDGWQLVHWLGRRV
jgi:predicted Ser/Thr protein kinase